MNERIKDLSLKAAYEVDLSDPKFLQKYTEKFTELLTKDIFTIIKEACIDTDFTNINEVINDRLQDAASDVVDEYGISDQIY